MEWTLSSPVYFRGWITKLVAQDQAGFIRRMKMFTVLDVNLQTSWCRIPPAGTLHNTLGQLTPPAAMALLRPNWRRERHFMEMLKTVRRFVK